MTLLFSPIKIRSVEVRNRIWVSPMCMYSCENQDGMPNDWHLVHLGARAVGGAGLVMAEATAVVPEGRITPWCTGIWNDEQIPAWKRVTDFIHAQGATSSIQLAHAGRKASTYRAQSGSGSVPLGEGGWETVSSTSEAFPGYAAPRELSTEEIEAIPAYFAAAAKRSISAGFQSIEIHAAHGYLMHQFLSPLTNKRTDKYGGSLQNRARLLLETVSAVRETIGPAIPLFVRFSATDYVEGGWDQAQTNQVAAWCHELGADLFDISSGGLVMGVKIPTGPGYQVPLAENLKSEAHTPVGAVGQITSGGQAEEILQRGLVDVVLVGREFLRDPQFPLRAAHELGEEITWPVQYERGRFPSA
ncbi:NADH:flavin oxidoreductase/NADH oxidase [Aquiluna sp. KACHI24]|uniref:NADH:flavin oxidoreductase/NADH oxidase n=1 Tax=Aquiluna sp. KACHI24 TaxID=2968831 RepID=UPI00220CCDC7|nr:NADH:flavin oxidoreductase/NADH oxidase [Aquiluna sp. KACHI24]BDQ00573.1 oxidoreductase [Aquiluna sp. KACHI24]